MEAVASNLPSWLPAYWVGVTVIRLVILIFVFYLFGQTVSVKKASARTAASVIVSTMLAIWVAAAIYLGRINFFRIDYDVPLPPPIAAGALLPILVGYIAFQYWETFRRIILSVPQHWFIGLQVYRITGGVFLVVYALNLVPGVFGLTAGLGDLLTGSLAIPVAYFWYTQKPWAWKAALIWNYIGLIELIILIPFGLLSSPSSIQVLALNDPNFVTSTWPSVLAPVFHVPLGMLLHIFSFAQLRQAAPTKAEISLPKIAWQFMLAAAIVIVVYASLFYILSPVLTSRPVAYQVYPALGEILANHQVGLYIHIIPSMLALILGPLQFHRGLRARYLHRHRWLGKTYLASVLLGGLGAFYIAQFSFAGLGSRLGFSVQAILLLFTAYMAYSHIRQGQIESHRAWMMRNYALIFAAVTLRLYIRIFFWMGLELPDFHALNAWLCWVPNLLFAEWLIRRSRVQSKRIEVAASAQGS